MVDKKSSGFFCCSECDYITSRKSQWDRHITTAKHLKLTSVDKKVPQEDFICECEYKCKTRQGLWKHRKTCLELKSSVGTEKSSTGEQDDKQKKTDLIALTELVKDVIKHNQELTNKIVDLCKISGGNTISHNNLHSNNKTFNLQFFLNETCKDAMNISEFVESIQFQLEDLEHVGEVGFVDGISDVVLENLTELNTRQRPIHCSDHKREILYIKDNNEWIKDDGIGADRRITKFIKEIAHKNMKVIPEWVKNNPDCHDYRSKKNDTYLKIVSNSMSGGTEIEQKNNINKIISKVAKKVTINKNICH